MIRLLYDLLQIQSYPKWKFIKRIKNYLKVRDIKKEITKSIYNKDEFFENIVDFVTFMDKAKYDLNIKITDNYKCKIVTYNPNFAKYSYILQYMINIDGIDYDVRFCYYTEESNRANVRLSMHDEKPSYHLTYDWYLDKDRIGSYRSIDTNKEKFLLVTMDYMNKEIMDLVNIVAKKYIYQRKEKNNEAEQEEV